MSLELKGMKKNKPDILKKKKNQPDFFSANEVVVTK